MLLTVDKIRLLVKHKLFLFVFYLNNWSKVNRALQKLADSNTENTEFLKRLADQTEDFAVQLIDQVTSREELVIRDVPEHVDRYASMLSGLTDDAIIQSQKKVRTLPKRSTHYLQKLLEDFDKRVTVQKYNRPKYLQYNINIKEAQGVLFFFNTGLYEANSCRETASDTQRVIWSSVYSLTLETAVKPSFSQNLAQSSSHFKN